MVTKIRLLCAILTTRADNAPSEQGRIWPPWCCTARSSMKGNMGACGCCGLRSAVAESRYRWQRSPRSKHGWLLFPLVRMMPPILAGCRWERFAKCGGRTLPCYLSYCFWLYIATTFYMNTAVVNWRGIEKPLSCN